MGQFKILAYLLNLGFLFSNRLEAPIIDSKKLTELFKLAASPLSVILFFCGLIFGVFEWFEPFLSQSLSLSLSGELVTLISFALSSIIAVISLGLAWRVVAKRSRLVRRDRFDLRVRQPAELLGRKLDIRDLEELIDTHILVFLDGESGCGKSSLLIFGLLPKLKLDSAKFPVIITNYSGDWDSGLAVRAFNVVWDALTKEERTKIGFSERPSIGSIDAETILKILGRIGNTLGRLPVFIFDQFDDYQLTHRKLFLDRNQAWISSRKLIEKNRFWSAISVLMGAKQIRVLITTRADTALGLHSVSMVENTGKRGLARLNGRWLPELLDGVVKTDDDGLTIENPEHGWTDLRKLLERDLTRDDAILPQQVRTALLGLRELPDLTPVSYRRAGGSDEVGALFIQASIREARTASGTPETQIRALLLALVDHDAGVSAKTQRCSGADLGSNIPDPVCFQKALECLESNEVIRRSIGVGEDEVLWQLDHDNLASAVLAEERAADQLSVRLRDGIETWQHAGWNLRARWRGMLTLSEQARMAAARLSTPFRYSGYRTYVAASLLRAVPLIVLLSFGLWGWNWVEVGRKARVIVDNLDIGEEGGKIAILHLWSAPSNVRARAVSQILDSPGRLHAAGTDWVNVVALGEAAANALVEDLLTQLTNRNLDSGSRFMLLRAIGKAADRLRMDSDEAIALVNELINQLANPNLDGRSQVELQRAIKSTTDRFKVGSNKANKLANDLRTQLTNLDLDSDTRFALLSATESVANRLRVGGKEVTGLINELLTQLANLNVDSDTRFALLSAIESVANRLKVGGKEVTGLVNELLNQLANPILDSDTRFALLSAIESVANRLKVGSKEANALVNELLTHLTNRNLVFDAWEQLPSTINRAAERLEVGSNEANALVEILLTQLANRDLDSDKREKLLLMINRAARRLEVGSHEINALVEALLTQLTKLKLVSSPYTLLRVIKSAADRLQVGSKEAITLVNELLAQLANRNLDSHTRVALLSVIESVADRLKIGSQEANTLVNELLTQLTNLNLDADTRLVLLSAIESVASQLKVDSDETNALVNNLRTQLVNDLFTQLANLNPDLETNSWFELLSVIKRVADRLKVGSKEANAIVNYLLTQLINSNLDNVLVDHLLGTIESTASRLKVGSIEVNKLARELHTQLTNLNSNTNLNRYISPRQAQLSAIASISGLLKAGSDEANALVKDLRTQLANNPNLDSDARRLIYDSLAQIDGEVIGNQRSNARRVTSLLVSVAFPIREYRWEVSPAWPLLEQAARRSFHGDMSAVMEWAMQTYRLPSDAARPNLTH